MKTVGENQGGYSRKGQQRGCDRTRRLNSTTVSGHAQPVTVRVMNPMLPRLILWRTKSVFSGMTQKMGMPIGEARSCRKRHKGDKGGQIMHQ